MSSLSPSDFKVVIIGGGVGGLTAALHLRKHHFTVTVLEAKTSYHDGNSGGGLSLTPNATCCFDALDIGDRFRAIADRGDGLHAIKYTDGSLAQYVPGQPRYMVHRADLLNLLATRAEELDVEMLRGERVERIQGSTVRLVNGKTIEADLIVGADGIHSKVREGILRGPNFTPKFTEQCTFLMYVPHLIMERTEDMQELYERGKSPIIFTSSPERSIVAWTMAKRGVFHLQVNDHSYGSGQTYGQEDKHPEWFVSSFQDMGGLRERWNDHGGAVKDIFDHVEECTKWLIAELPDLPSWSSNDGKVVLIGDAAHAFPPYAGQAAAMAVEDAAILAVLVGKTVRKGLPVKNGTEAFEKMRRPRIELIREVIKANVARWSATKPPSANPEPDKLVIDRGKAEVVREYDPMKEAEAYPLT